jgi:two-component system nitrate/nitrite response regulator NarL
MRVVLIDDHPVVRQGLEQCFNMEPDMEVVGMAASCAEGVALIASEKPDLAVVDLRIPGGSGLELIKQVQARVPDCRFVILTSFVSRKEVAAAIANNVEGYILKDALPDELVNAIRMVARGRRYYDPEILESIMNAHEDPFKVLTHREIDILQALTEGLTNKAIAEKYVISENTVKKHICNILDKLELNDRTQAALFALSHGLGKEENFSL